MATTCPSSQIPIHVGLFISERARVDGNYLIKASTLYQAFQDWCREKEKPVISMNAFGRELTRRGFSRQFRHDGTYRCGIIIAPSIESLSDTMGKDLHIE